MRSSSQRHNQSGDTIVEVLITVAIISSVLMGAFLVSQKSVKAIRDSQEHSEMLQVLQGQVEMTRSIATKQASSTGGIFSTSPRYFCIDAKSGSVNYGKRVDQSSMGASLDNFASYSPACKNVQGRYNVAAKYNGTNTFTFYGSWDSVTGTVAHEQISYRVYSAAP